MTIRKRSLPRPLGDGGAGAVAPPEIVISTPTAPLLGACGRRGLFFVCLSAHLSTPTAPLVGGEDHCLFACQPISSAPEHPWWESRTFFVLVSSA